MSDNVNAPKHYQSSIDGLECIDVIEAFALNFALGNAIKYILRAGKKGERAEDLRKARWYLDRELGSDGYVFFAGSNDDRATPRRVDRESALAETCRLEQCLDEWRRWAIGAMFPFVDISGHTDRAMMDAMGRLIMGLEAVKRPPRTKRRPPKVPKSATAALKVRPASPAPVPRPAKRRTKPARR